MRKLTATLLILLSLTALSCATQSVYGQSGRIVVPDNYRTIQEAIDHAPAGGTVFVKAGTYEGCLSINKSLSLIGEDKTKTTIKGGWELGGTVILVAHDGVTVRDFTIQSNAKNTHGVSIRGVHLLGVQGCTVSECVFSHIGKGIWLYQSSNNTVEGNFVDGTPRYIGTCLIYSWSGITLEGSSNNTIRSNRFTDSSQSGIEVFGSHGNNITGNYVTSRWSGLNIEYSNGNTVADNSIKGYRYGVWLQAAASHNTIENNSITDSLTGIQANWNSTNNLIVKNTITGSNYCGIEIHSNSSYTKVIANNITGNKYGIEIQTSKNNILRYNNITGSEVIGGLFVNASENLIRENNFVGNTRQVFCSLSNNTWDAGGRGNFWSDYNGTDSNSDGVGDSPYVIDESNLDHYPLVNVVNCSDSPKITEIANSETPENEIPQPDSQTLIAVIIGTAVGAGLCLGTVLLYRKRRRLVNTPAQN
ncbi:MAG: right-handed parallel beta-helix repeat-containing protein [Candidatus Bathyarchaeia archaeon]